MFWFLACFFWVAQTPLVSMEKLEEAEVFSPLYAFAHDDNVYMLQRSRIALIPKGGKPKVYEKSGRGPSEFMVGMIFQHGKEAWVYDQRNNKFLVFDLALNYLRDVSLRDVPTSTRSWVSDGDTLYNLARQEDGFAVVAFNSEMIKGKTWPIPDLQQQHIFTPYMGYAGHGWLFFFLPLQNTSEFVLHLFHAPSETFKKVSAINPDFDSANANAPFQEGHGLALDGAWVDDDKLYVFSQGNNAEAIRLHDESVTTRWYHAFDLETHKPLDLGPMEGAFRRQHGPSQWPLLFHDERGLIVFETKN